MSTQSPEAMKKEVAALMRDYRKKKKLTQEGLAEVADVPARTIQDLEAGYRFPRFETIFKLCKGMKLNHKVVSTQLYQIWDKYQD